MVPGFMTRFNQEDQIVLLKRGKWHFLTPFGDVLFCPDCFFVRIHTIIWSHETKAFAYYGNYYLDMYLQWKTFNLKAWKSILKPLKITLCFAFFRPKSAKSQCCFSDNPSKITWPQFCNKNTSWEKSEYNIQIIYLKLFILSLFYATEVESERYLCYQRTQSL